MSFQHLLVECDGPVARLVLNRPEVRNAFNDALVEELHTWADDLARDAGDVRVVVLSGAGKVFCAGADLAWMRRTADASRAENVRDAQRLAAMFEALDRLPVPLVGRVQGAALGGGAGLAAVCDMVAAADDALFGFTEVKLGVVPGVISPYVLAKIGRSAARALFLTGARFGAQRAEAIGLVHHVVPAAGLDDEIARIVGELLLAGPEAVAAAKQMIRQVWRLDGEEASDVTADAIATRRASAEGQEGITAFLEKRRPTWARQA
jgi:methylglutaconyl-CoA hydratase